MIDVIVHSLTELSAKFVKYGIIKLNCVDSEDSDEDLIFICL